MSATTEDPRVADLLRRRKLLAQEATQARCGACGSILSDDGSCSGCGSTLHRLDAPPSSKRSKSSAHCPKCTGRINTFAGKCPRCDAKPVVAPPRPPEPRPAPQPYVPRSAPSAPVVVEPTPEPEPIPTPEAAAAPPIPAPAPVAAPLAAESWRPERATYRYHQSADDMSLKANDGNDLVVEITDGGTGPYLVLQTQRWALSPDDIDRLAATLRQCLASCTGVRVDGED